MEESDVGAFGLFQAMIEVVDDPDIAAVADVPDPVVVNEFTTAEVSSVEALSATINSKS